MTNLSPDLRKKLTQLLPRLASDSDGEVLTTVAALRRTLDRWELNLHDFTALLADAPQPFTSLSRWTGSSDHTPFSMASWLQANAMDRLTMKDRDFVMQVSPRMECGRTLTPKQLGWLHDLYNRHRCNHA